MPIKFACTHCQQQIEVSRKAAGRQAKCPACKQVITIPAFGDPGKAAQEEVVDLGSFNELEPVAPEPEAEAQAPARGRRRGGNRGGGGGVIGGFMSLLRPPSGAMFFLWLGIVLILGGFVLKHLAVNVTISSVPKALELPRLMAEREAKLFAVDDEVDEIREELDAFYEEERDRDEERDFERERERRERLEERLDDAREEAREDRDKIVEEYEERIRDARQDNIEAGASSLGWMQMGIWVKILVDLPKLLGVCLVMLSSLSLISDPEQDGYVKSYAIACSTVVLIYATLYAVLAVFS